MRRLLLIFVMCLPLSFLAFEVSGQTYCAASGGCDEHISNVTVGTINNSSACTPAGYHDYTTISTLMLPGQAYPITVTNGNPYSSDQCGIWIDWNKNGNFADDAPITVVGTPGNGPYTATITVPPTAIPGNTRMRVRIMYTGTLDPCGTTVYGEVEDYTITVGATTSLDAGVLAITEPTTPTPPTTSPVTVVLMNFGTTTLTSATLNYSMNGVPGTPFLWTGSLANLAKDTVTIGNVVLPQGTHVFKAWSSLPNGLADSAAYNDTATATIVVSSLLQYQLGTGVVVNSTTGYPSPYGQYYTGDRVQYLILASEMNAIGAYGGNMISLGFDVVTPTTPTSLGNNLNGYTIKIGTTTATSLATWLPTTTTLFTVPSLVTTVGWNTHTFNSPYFWDGVSNLVIETCFDNYAGTSNYTTNAVVRQTTTPFSSCIDYRSDGGGVCTNTLISGTFTQRPNMQLTFAPSVPNDAGIVAIVSPVSPASPGVGNVAVNLRNFGTANLTSATIGWSVNGVAQTSYAWTGNLASSGMASNILLGTYNFPLGTHTIKAWTSLPNGAVDSASYNDTATYTLIVCNLLTGVYTVGDTTADYPSIQAAVDAVSVCGVSGPVTFNILPGTYNTQVTIPPIPGTSATNRVTFKSSTSNASDVIIANTASSTGNYTVRLSGADYVDLQYLTIQANHPTNARVVELSMGADNNLISNCVIFGNPSARGTSSSAGIYSGSTNDTGNIFTNNIIENGYYGIYMYGVGSTNLEAGTVIEGNTLSGFFYYGIYLYYQKSAKVRSNTLTNHSSSAYVYGIYGYYAQEEYEVSGNRLNITGSSSTYGIYSSYCTALSDFYPGMTVNNFVTTNGPGTAYALYLNYCNYQYVYHNSVLVNGGSTSGRAAYFNYGANNRSVNNIFVNLGGGYATYVSSTPLIVSNYNCYFTSGSTLGYWGSSVTDLTALQLASGMDLNSVSMNPSFATSTLLYPTNYTLNNLGTPLALVAEDIDGVLRDPLTPDMGAAEFSPAQNDAGISVINSPGAVAGPGLSSISATIKNFGLANLTLATMWFSVNGGTPVSTLWTGNLASGLEDGPVVIGSHTFTYGSHQVKVWTSGPNSQNDPNKWNDTLVMTVYVCDVFNGTYTIGPTGSGADYPTIVAALNDLNSCGISGPTTFSIYPGTYTGQVNIGQLPGASAINTVTFQSSTGVAADVILTYAATGSGDNYVVRLDGADYITLQNMTIKTATTGTFGYGIVLANSANYNIILGNVIESVPGTTSSSTAGIYSGTTLDEYNIISGNTIRYGYYGIYLGGPSTASTENGNIVDGNIVTDWYYYGIYQSYQRNHVINGNTFTNASNSGVVYPLRAYYCYDGTIMTKNRVNMTGTSTNYGLYLYYTVGTATDPALVANNMIAQSAPTSGSLYMGYIGYSNYVRIYHNSWSARSTATNYGIYLVSTNPNSEFVNNMVVNLGGGQTLYGSSLSYFQSFAPCNYNNLFTTGTNLVYSGTNHSNLAAWRLASGLDSNSVSINPQFYTFSSLYPTNLAVNDLGTPIIMIPDDIDGNLRDPLTPDMGAVEFEPPANDAGISVINSPTSPQSPGSLSISATVKNYGYDNLLTANVHWSIDGGPATTQLWTGLLTPGQESTAINLGSHTFTYGVYTLKVWTSMPNGQTDPMALNDTMTRILNICDIMSGTYTIGGSGADYPTFAAALTALNGCGVGAPVIFNVQPGTYTTQVSIGEIAGASATNTVTFQSSTGIPADVTISYAATGTADNFVVRLNGADYITLKNMTIKTATTGTFGYAVVLANGANYNTITGNVIESVPNTTSSSTAVIYSGSTIDEYNVISDNILRYGYYGVYLYGVSSGSLENGNIVDGNTIENWYYYGIYPYYQSDMIMNDNILTNATNSGIVYPLRSYYCYDGTIVTNNRVTMTGTSTAYGMYVYYTVGSTTEWALIANNIVNQTNTTSSTAYGVYLGYSNNVRFYHNTFRTQSTGTNYGVYFVGGTSQLNFVNNMVTIFGGGYAMYGTVANLQTMTVCNYNNYYSSGANLAYAGAAVTTLAAWQLATGLDTNSISANPGYLAPNNPTPGSASVNNLGTPATLALVPNDINGVVRNPFTPDIGAIEFDPIAFEAANLGFVNPVGGCDAGIQPVSIRINNRGGQSINGGLTASYRIIGTSTVYTDTVTAIIPSGDTLHYTFQTPIDLTTPADSIFKLISWIQLTGDPLPGNDTATRNVNSLVSPPAPQVANVTIPYGQTATLAVINPDTNNLYYWYDVPVGGTYLVIDTTYTTPQLFNTTVYYVEATGGMGKGSLLTTMVSGNGQTGAMFNLTAVNPVTVDSFYVNTASSGTVEVYYKVGTYIGFENAASAWTLAGSASITAAGVGNNTLVPVGGFSLTPGQTYGVYVTLVSGTLQYTNGTGSNEFYTDGNLSFQGGAGIAYPFGSIFTPRVFNGTIHYSSGNGCASMRVADTVFVNAPVVTVNAGVDKSMCQGDTTQLNAVVSGGVSPYTYAWSPSISLSNASIPNPLAFPMVNTTYSVTVTDQNSDSGTDDIIVTVKPAPNVTFTPVPSVYITTPSFQLTTGLPAGGTYSGPGVSGGIFNPSVAGSGYHTLTYTYTDPVTGCTGSATAQQFVDPAMGLDEAGQGIGLTLYPNPSQGKVVLTVRSVDKDMLLEVLDVQGKAILERNLINANGRHELDLSNLPPGIYNLRLTGEKDSYLQKLVLQ